MSDNLAIHLQLLVCNTSIKSKRPSIVGKNDINFGSSNSIIERRQPGHLRQSRLAHTSNKYQYSQYAKRPIYFSPHFPRLVMMAAIQAGSWRCRIRCKAMLSQFWCCAVWWVRRC